MFGFGGLFIVCLIVVIAVLMSSSSNKPELVQAAPAPSVKN